MIRLATQFMIPYLHSQRFLHLGQKTLLRHQAVQMHFSSQPQTLEKINNYESLISLISSSETIPHLMKVYGEHQDIFHREHFAQTARSIARLQAKLKPDNYEALKDKTYLQFTENMAKSLHLFSEIELLDLLFWIRKYKGVKGGLGAMESKMNEVVEKIIEFVKKDQYKFKQLATIFFDISILGRNCDDVATKLIAELNKDSNQLSPFITLNILQTIALKEGINSGKELILVDIICKCLPTLLPQLDINQKSLVFKQISQVEPFIHPPKYKMPSVMFTLKNELKEQVDSLNEAGVLNVIIAYKQLINSHFPQDLLEEIKEMVMVTVKHNSVNIKSPFLVDFLEAIAHVQKKRKSDIAKMSVILSELIKRVRENDVVLLLYKGEKLIHYCDKYLKAQSPLIIEIAKNFESKIKTYYLQSVVDLVAKKATPKEFDGLMKSYFSGEDMESKVNQLKQQNKHYIIRLGINLFSHKERHQELFTIVSKHVDEMVQNEPLTVIVSQSHSSNHNQYKRDILLKSVSNYMLVCSKDSDGQVVRAIISSSDLRDVRMIWLNQYFKKNPLSATFINKFVETYFLQEGFDNQEKLMTLLNILSHSKVFPSKLFFTLAKENNKFLQDITKNDYIFRKLLSQLLEAAKQNPEQIRLINIYQVCLRLESLNLRLDCFYKFMSKIYDIFFNQEGVNTTRERSAYITFLYQLKLLENNSLSVASAKEAFENQKVADIMQKGKFLSFIAKHDQEYFQSHKEDYDIYFKTLLSSLNSVQSTLVLNNIACIIRLPASYLKSENNYIIKTFKEHINSIGDSSSYTNVFTSIQSKQGEINQIVIKELISHFPQIQRRLLFSDTRRILQKMVQLDVKDNTLITHILQEIGNNFFSMSCEDKVLCLQAFCNMRIRQDDFIARCLQGFQDQMLNYRSHYIIIMDSLFKVGYESQLLSEYLLRVLKTWKLSYQEFAVTLALISISKSKHQTLVEEISLKLQNPNSYLPQSITFPNNQYLTLCTLYYSKLHSQQPEILKFLDKYRGTQEKTASPTKFIFSHTAYSQIQKFIGAMGIEYKTNYQIDNYEVPLAIPSTNQIIKVNGQNNLNFDKKQLDGKSQIELSILESIENHSVVSINMSEFYGLRNDQLAKINFLLKLGIKCDSKNKYDFSKCSKFDFQYFCLVSCKYGCLELQNEDIIEEVQNISIEAQEDLSVPGEEDITVPEDEKINKQSI